MKIRVTLLLALVLAVALAPPAAAQTAGVADTLREVRLGDHGYFERAVLDLGTKRTDSQVVPYYRWARVAGQTVVRIQLPTVTNTLVTDGRGAGKGISRYYAVRSADGNHLFVDLHLTDTAGPVRVFYLNHPARIVVDVPTGAPENPYPEAKFGKRTVLMQPRAGYAAGPGVFTVTGYGRPFEAQGVWRIKDASGDVVRKGTYHTSDWSATWGRFAFSASYPASLSGSKGSLEVGEVSARDGRFQGVSAPLYFR
ncbi:MAG: Gmad2 immunoglobulin-like domain-containing protein [Actinomycetota bacterium]